MRIPKKKETFNQIIVTKFEIVKENKGVGKLQDIAYFQTLS